MRAFKIPSLPKDVLLKDQRSEQNLLAKTAQAIADIPQVVVPREAKKTPQDAEAVASVMYLTDVMVRLLEKIASLRNLPLERFTAQTEAYISETAATLPETLREVFLRRAKVYATAIASELDDKEQAAENSFNRQDFFLLIENLEAFAIEAITLPEDVQAQAMATALADYKHALEGGEAIGFIPLGLGGLMLENLQEDMAFAAAEFNVAQSDAPTFLALLIASGETGLTQVDALPQHLRLSLLEKQLKTVQNKEKRS